MKGAQAVLSIDVTDIITPIVDGIGACDISLEVKVKG